MSIPASKFRISIPAASGAVQGALFKAFVLLIGCLLGGLYLGWQYMPLRWATASVAGLGLISLACLVIIQWTLRLMFHKGPVFGLDDDGVRDEASLFNPGRWPLADLRRLRLIEMWGMDMLEIRVRSRSTALQKLSRRWGFMLELHRLFFGSKFFIPLGFLHTSKFDLESRLIHFSLERLVSSSTPGTDEMGGLTPTPSVAQATQEPFVMLFSEDAQGEKEEPPPVHAYRVQPGDNTVIRRIKAIKAKVVLSGLDQAVTELYFDEIRNYPRWKQTGDTRLPQAITQVTGSIDDPAYEEVSFFLEGDRYRFGLRRDIEEEGDAALLSIGVRDQVVMALKVRVEIGQLEPLDVEQYLEGPWILTLQSLINLVRARREREANLRLSPEARSKPNTSQLSDEELEQLKKRFGLS